MRTRNGHLTPDDPIFVEFEPNPRGLETSGKWRRERPKRTRVQAEPRGTRNSCAAIGATRMPIDSVRAEPHGTRNSRPSHSGHDDPGRAEPRRTRKTVQNTRNQVDEEVEQNRAGRDSTIAVGRTDSEKRHIRACKILHADRGGPRSARPCRADSGQTASDRPGPCIQVPPVPMFGGVRAEPRGTRNRTRRRPAVSDSARFERNPARTRNNRVRDRIGAATEYEPNPARDSKRLRCAWPTLVMYCRAEPRRTRNVYAVHEDTEDSRFEPNPRGLRDRRLAAERRGGSPPARPRHEHRGRYTRMRFTRQKRRPARFSPSPSRPRRRPRPRPRRSPPRRRHRTAVSIPR